MISYDRVTIGGITITDRLENKKYVSRTVSKQGRRAREVRLTKLGSQVYTEVYPVVDALQQEILSGLDKNERQQFLALARKIVGLI